MARKTEINVGYRYQLIRELLLFTIKEVILITGIPKTTIRDIELGFLPLGTKYTDRLKDLYQINEEDLLNPDKQLPDWKALRRKVLSKHKDKPFIINALNKSPMPQKAIQFRVLKSSFLHEYKTVQETILHLKTRYTWTFSTSDISNAFESLKSQPINGEMNIALIEIKDPSLRPQEFRKAKIISSQPEVIIDQIWIHLEESAHEITSSIAAPAFERMAGMLFFLRKGEQKRVDILDSVNYANIQENHLRSLNILVEMNLVEMTIPDKPRSNLQRFRLTEEGWKLLGKVGVK